MKSFVGVMLSVILIVCLGVAGAVAYGYYQLHIAPAGSPVGDVVVDVPPGTSFGTLRVQLERQGVQGPRWAYRAWLYLYGRGRKLRVGEFAARREWPLSQTLDAIVNGTPLLHKVVLKEGNNVWDLELLLQSVNLSSTRDAYLRLIRDPALLARAQVPAPAPQGGAAGGAAGVERSLEGFLFPETYAFQKYDTARSLVEAMLRQFETRALRILKEHPWGATPEGRYRLLTLASVVEKESGVAAEQPIIAAVFWNRLKKKMKLQSDPTIIYGLMPNFDGNIRKSQILAPTPYNTYTVPELPVGPIANPGESALRAVVHPGQSDALFFVARGDGTHIFARDYADHERNVRQFQLGGRARAAAAKAGAGATAPANLKAPTPAQTVAPSGRGN